MPKACVAVDTLINRMLVCLFVPSHHRERRHIYNSSKIDNNNNTECDSMKMYSLIVDITFKAIPREA